MKPVSLKGVIVPAITPVNELRDALVVAGPCWLAGIKYALSRLGLGSGAVISPLEPAPAAQRQRIENLLASRTINP